MKDKIKINPWISILTKPKETIKAIIKYNVNHRLILLSFIYGLGNLFIFVQNLKIGVNYNLLTLLIIIILLAPLWGYILLNISSWFLKITGRLIGGKGNFKGIRIATAWSQVPIIVNIFVALIVLLFFPDPELFTQLHIFLLFILVTMQLIASIWALVIYINAIAEVQKFSILKTIFNIILMLILGGIITAIITLACKWTCSSFFDQPILVNISF